MNETKTHRGAYLKRLIDDSDLKVYEILEAAEINRTTLFRWTNDENLSFDRMAKICRVLKHDFLTDFPEAENEIGAKLRNELKMRFKKELSLETKYTDLQEKYTNLLEKYSALLQNINQNNGTITAPKAANSDEND